MRTKRKAVMIAATINDGNGQMQMDGFPKAPHILNYTPKPGTIASLLLHGESNAIKAAELSRITGQKIREITSRVSQERRNGAPIMSSPSSGYWLAENREEVKRCAAALHARATEIHRTAKALEEKI